MLQSSRKTKAINEVMASVDALADAVAGLKYTGLCPQSVVDARRKTVLDQIHKPSVMGLVDLYVDARGACTYTGLCTAAVVAKRRDALIQKLG